MSAPAKCDAYNGTAVPCPKPTRSIKIYTAVKIQMGMPLPICCSILKLGANVVAATAIAITAAFAPYREKLLAYTFGDKVLQAAKTTAPAIAP